MAEKKINKNKKIIPNKPLKFAGFLGNAKGWTVVKKQETSAR